ncbi:hypothetical protein ACFR9U_02720 [Halorientalis brevis]|uniref:Glycosyltransferase RgtA/B/C/D-like domain-containing protein n=1 Tax=Halorientalis brevis TaxID=1126241 RepID=A0ABD6C9D2_9EURY|nr:hypothetical protein [Halorientalis brevis]
MFITDTYAIGNALAAVSSGHLDVRSLQYSLTFGSQPGLYVSDGAVYGRNYAHVFLALPVLWLLEAVSWLFDLRLALAAGFSLLVYLLADRLGHLVDCHQSLTVGGAVAALIVFLLNVVNATPLDSTWRPFMALQITSMLAAGFVAVGLYRLLAHVHGRRSGAVIGLFVVVASPLGFWASIPKRHVLSSLAVVTLLATFYVARATDSNWRALGARSLSYTTVGLLTWLHGGEALILFAALVPLDFLTAPSNRPRDLAVVGLVFLLALTPFLLTNLAIAGNPLEPPRTLSSYSGQIDPGANAQNGATGGSGSEGTGETATQTGTATGTTTPAAGSASTTTGSSSADSAPPNLDRSSAIPTIPVGLVGALIAVISGLGTAVVDRALWALEKIWSLFGGGIEIVIDEPERLYHTFIRSGRIPTYVKYGVNEQEAIELALLEAVPLAGALVGAIGVAGRKALANPSVDALLSDLQRPERQTDLLAITVGCLFVLVYITRLPLYAQITVRYLLPIVPLGLYGVGRLGAVHRVARANWRYLAGSYLGLTLVGAVVFFGAHGWLDLALGEAMQLYALVGLASATLIAVWSLVEGVGFRLGVRFGAVVLALPAALTTLFLLFTGFVYFQYAEYALPLARAIGELIPVVV